MQAAGASFVLRLYNNAGFERLGPARALSAADRAAAVVEDVAVRLGAHSRINSKKDLI